MRKKIKFINRIILISLAILIIASLVFLLFSTSLSFLFLSKTSAIGMPTNNKPMTSPSLPNYYAEATGKNVIVIQMEAFQNFPIQKSLMGHTLTPNLNNLINDSIYFKNGISQIASGNTSDAEFILNTSIYPPTSKAPFLNSTDKPYIALPTILKKQGYYSATFHTNTADFWNRKNMYPSLGFDTFYDKTFFGTDETIFYGASDKILYEKTLEELKNYKKIGKNFYVNLVTISSHAFFRNKEWMKPISFGGNYDKAIVGRYLAAVEYTDRQLGSFLDKLKKSGLYDNSLIVIYGDHFGLTYNNMEAEYKNENNYLIEKVLGRPYDNLDYINIPIIFKLPSSITKNRTFISELPAGQMDIMPTILNLLGVKDTDGKFFGNDLLNIENNLLGLRFYMPTGSLIDSNGLYIAGSGLVTFDHKILKGSKPSEDSNKKLKDLLYSSDLYLNNLPKK